MASAKPKKYSDLTAKEKQEVRKIRNGRHAEKRGNAMANLTAKVAALGDDAMLDEYELCAYLGRSVQWARLHRTNNGVGGGSLLPYKKIGAAVRYRLGDIKAAA